MYQSCGEHFAVSLVGFFRNRKITGKIAANQALPRHSGSLLRGVVDVGYTPIFVNRDQWVQTGFDQAAGVKRGPAQFFLGTLALGDITCRGEYSVHLSFRVLKYAGVVHHVHNFAGRVSQSQRTRT